MSGVLGLDPGGAVEDRLEWVWVAGGEQASTVADAPAGALALDAADFAALSEPQQGLVDAFRVGEVLSAAAERLGHVEGEKVLVVPAHSQAETRRAWQRGLALAAGSVRRGSQGAGTRAFRAGARALVPRDLALVVADLAALLERNSFQLLQGVLPPPSRLLVLDWAPARLTVSAVEVELESAGRARIVHLHPVGCVANPGATVAALEETLARRIQAELVLGLLAPDQELAGEADAPQLPPEVQAAGPELAQALADPAPLPGALLELVERALPLAGDGTARQHAGELGAWARRAREALVRGAEDPGPQEPLRAVARHLGVRPRALGVRVPRSAWEHLLQVYLAPVLAQAWALLPPEEQFAQALLAGPIAGDPLILTQLGQALELPARRVRQSEGLAPAARGAALLRVSELQPEASPIHWERD